jgi:Las17-binding protein actin regulator
MIHTAGVGFLVGVDIYDCVMVINTEAALQAFQKVRCTVGGEISAVAGPVGMGGVLDSEVHKRRAPIFTYLKSRGFYAGVQIDGTILIERTDENERFYGYRLPAQEILAGKVRHPPLEIQTLMQTIKAAQGDGDVDESLLPTEAPPSDFEIVTEPKLFGVPDKDDPDPYGVLALEKEGFQIREAGTHQRPTWEQFTFSPSPSSPVFSTFKRESMDGKSPSRRSSWRKSAVSTVNSTYTANTDRPVSTMSDMATQTNFDTPATSPISMGSTKRMPEIHEEASKDETPKISEPAKAIELPPTPSSSQSKDSPYVADNETSDAEEEEEDDDEDEDGVVIEEPVIVHEVHRATATSPQFLPRVRLVQVKQIQAPSLPVRNPIRDRKIPPPLPPRAHSRNSSVSTPRDPEQSSGHRSGSEDSMSSVELLSGLEKHLQRSSIAEKPENAEQFHSIPTTPAGEHANPIGGAL